MGGQRWWTSYGEVFDQPLWQQGSSGVGGSSAQGRLERKVSKAPGASSRCVGVCEGWQENSRDKDGGDKDRGDKDRGDKDGGTGQDQEGCGSKEQVRSAEGEEKEEWKEVVDWGYTSFRFIFKRDAGGVPLAFLEACANS